MIGDPRLRAPAIALVAVLLATSLQSSPLCAAHGSEGQKPVAAGREALGRMSRVPWYDADRDALRPIELRAPRQAAPEIPGSSLLRYAAWGALAVLLVLMIALAYLALRHYSPGDSSVDREQIAISNRAAVEALPFMSGRSADDLLGQARRHYELGNYNEAIVYLFSYELVELDRFAYVRLDRGKTNRQYVRETSRAEPLRALLERTMVAFESVFFGGHELDRPGFEACWSELAHFEILASQGTA
jgi:hypothetical protein